MFDFLPQADAARLRPELLQQVVAQVRFGNQGSLSTQQGASAVHDAIAERYPRLTAEQQVVVTAGPSAGVSTNTTVQYRMQDLRGDWAVVISPEHATIETSVYEDWTELRKRMSEVLAAVADVAKLRIRERVGLRYINHVPANDDGSFDGRIRPEVLGIAAEKGWRPLLAGVVSQLIANDQGVSLALRYGLAPDESGNAPYLVDIDCSNSEPVPYDENDTIGWLDNLNDVSYRSFCWCIESAYRENLLENPGTQP